MPAGRAETETSTVGVTGEVDAVSPVFYQMALFLFFSG